MRCPQKKHFKNNSNSMEILIHTIEFCRETHKLIMITFK